MSVKRLSITHWSAHHAAVKPVKDKFDECVAAIEALCDPCKNVETRGATQEEAQHLVEHAIEESLLKADQFGITVERRLRIKKRMTGEQLRDAGLAIQEENNRAVLECVNCFISELQTRLTAIKEVANMFETVQAKSLLSAAEEELRVSVPKMTTFYDELSKVELLKEIPRLRRHMTAADVDIHKAKDWSIFDILKFILDWDFLKFLPILTLSLQLFLTICVSVASCERSFSKLKLIKNYLRSSMGQSRVSDLAILSIESDMVKDINVDEVIDRLAALKTRKRNF
ncbi:uncharacterized protein LOC136086277 [Hydra vulgaris]|uniref:Uncharacterized protein LOC136086277 n=1 Tax=Hydra vulgaris TaxID=6087 RepID=A0ABM4CRX3_HYDVU